MIGRRARLPVLAEVSAPATVDSPAWSLRRADFEQLAGLLEQLPPPSAVLVTGAEAVTETLAIALAGVAAASGRRTALLECDLDRPRLAADLGLSPVPGLHEYLRWEAEPADLLQPLALGGSAAGAATEPLVCIAAGRQAADPATLLGLGSFSHMATKLRSAYDLLVLAGPPLGAPFAALEQVAARADAILVAVGPDQQSGQSAKAVRAVVRHLPSRPLGTVVVTAEQ